MPERVAVVGADPVQYEALARELEGVGLACELQEASRTLPDRLVVSLPAVVLIVQNPPNSQAFDALRAIRGDRTVHELPVLLVGRDESAALDTIVAFELGTDDYVRVSAGHREIALRTRAVLRRGAATSSREGLSFRQGPFEVDATRHVATVEGRMLDLTAIEFRLLFELVRSRGRVMTRGDLLTRVWSVEPASATRTLDTHVKRLREKLGDARHMLETVRGVGYRLRAAP